MKKPQFDIILFGATSFVGRLVARQIQTLIDQNSTAIPAGFIWAIAARNESALLAVKDSLGSGAVNLSTVIADAHNEEQLRLMCEQCRVVISTVGPYALYGETLVKVCCETGTDYCDLTGEPQWIKSMMERYEKIAQQAGTRIVNCCGFDSIPSDLGVYQLEQLAHAAHGKIYPSVKLGVKAMKGGFSGGTLASMINGIKEAIADPSLRKQLGNPYLLCPDNHRFNARQPKSENHFDVDFNSWTTPFFMAGINTKIVHRTNALLNTFYGTNFTYSENMLLGKNGRWRAMLTRFGLGLFVLLLIFPVTRWLLQHWVLPKPGQGPTEAQQQAGHFTFLFLGQNENDLLGNNSLLLQVEGKGDPGYRSTAKMLTQAALCLAFDTDKSQGGGFFTPAALFGDKLVRRLESYAEVSFLQIGSQAD